DLIVVEVQARNSVARFRMLGFLLEAESATFRIQFNDTIALGIIDLVSENRRAGSPLSRSLQKVSDSRAKEDIVAKNQGDGVFPDKIRPEGKCLRQTIGTGLDDVRDVEAP